MTKATMDLVYARRSPRNVLDIVVPDASAPPPLVVFIHGGAFRMGDKSDAARERRALLDAGFAVASVNYRYSTEAIWPAQLDDLGAAFAWLRGHATDRLGPPRRVQDGELMRPTSDCGSAFPDDHEARPSTRRTDEHDERRDHHAGGRDAGPR